MADVLVLGTADWDQAIATNQHYAVRELSHEHDVTFVQSMGLRKVEMKARDITRIARRVWRLVRPRRIAISGRPVPERVRVVSPRAFPRHRGAVRRLNQASLARQFRTWSGSPHEKVLWLYSPLDYGLAQSADLVVYHCVDLLGTVPGIDSELIARGERRLASLNNVVAAGSSPAVVEHLRQVGFDNPQSWPNVADTGVFVEPTADADRARRDAVVFAGNLTETKVDFPLLEALLQKGLEVHLAGPIAEGGGDARAKVRRLVEMGATYHGLLEIDALAELQASCSVGLIPYVSNEYTAGVSPLKTFEYLASGLAVVSTGVPSVSMVPDHVHVVPRAYFVPTVKGTIAAPAAATVRARQGIAAAHGWDARGDVMRRAISDRLRRSDSLNV